MTKLHHDFETYSPLPLGSSKSVGTYRYTRHPDFEVLMCGYALDNDRVEIWMPHHLFPLDRMRIHLSPEYVRKTAYFTNSVSKLRRAISDRKIRKHAHNAEFERLCVKHGQLGCRLPEWSEYRCSAALCSTLALPRGLDDAATALGLKGKDKEGKKLINRFCKPRKPTKNDPRTRIMPMDDPEGFIDFALYCVQDVEVERALEKRLEAFALSPLEQRVWEMNCEANERGVPVDLPNVRKAWAIVEEFIERDGGIFTGITGLRVTQRAKFQAWLHDRGFEIPNLQGDTIDPILEQVKAETLELDSDIARALATYRTAGRSSVKKLKAMLEFANDEGRVNETSVYHGAQPGRYTGKFIQPHNFARPSRAVGNTMTAFNIINTGNLEFVDMCYKDPMEAVSSVLRHYIKAPDGRELLVADFSSVEARGICWLAGQEDALEEYRRGVDRYISFGASIKDLDYTTLRDAYEAGDKEADFIRQGGKVGVLQCGYQAGRKSVRDAAESNYGLVLTMEEAAEIVAAYRRQHPKVKQLWHDVGEAALQAVKHRKTTRVGKLLIGMKDIFLFIKLPSGRKIAYPFPKVELQTAPWDRNELEDIKAQYRESEDPEERVELKRQAARIKARPKKETITYWGKPRQGGGKWVRRSTYGGKLCQNATEAICRDLLVNAMVKAEPHGIEYIMLVHDELVNEVAEGVHTLDEYNRIICELPDWAEGFPLAADGYIAKHYRK